ncbi:RNA polymerase sigma factor [Daejeonella sp.]|uniref:RNA polymerase sigma factor n=1 Tax=Daejeonella sp. TaxID=2805397 RepID=UPI0027300839|nr:RNA polymerase sigma-70 factor [Daejeonella sp.]MDP2415128.1 RNA polymerase sigma-70 factor [Daejeonella sp.]
MKILQNESEILRLVSEGNELAFREIFNHYSSRLYNYTFRITDDEELSEEIVMDAFLKVWCNRQGLGEIVHFGSYLYTLVRNRAFNAIKRRALEAVIIGKLSLNNSEYQDTTEETVIYKEYQHILGQAVNQLPPQQRIVFSMSRDEGMKYEEIANHLNLSKNTVKAHLKKALSTLRLVVSNYLVLNIYILFSNI